MKNPSKFSVLSAAAACLALSLTACGSSAPEKSGADEATGSKPVTLTVGTFNEFGYEKLFDEYETLNPNVTIEHKKAATSNEARDNLTTRLAAGSGLSDIEGVEVDWLPELLQYPDRFTDLSDPAVEGRWLDWKTDAAKTPDGKLLGYGTDSGPEAVCYNAELLKKAGCPPNARKLRRCWAEPGTATSRPARSSRPPTRGGMVRLRGRHLPGHEQPAGEGLRGGGRHRHRRRTTRR